MPCDTVRETKVDLGNVNGDLLRAALAELGVMNYTLKNGVVTFTPTWNANPDVNAIKRAYSATVLQTQAKRFGWSVQKQGEKFVLQKASMGKRL